MEFNTDLARFVIPIYSLDDKQEKYFNGTGFIVGDYLITAGHVSYNEGGLFVIYDDCKYKLPRPIYEKYCSIEDGIKHDLSIYKVDFVTSPLTLCTTEFAGKVQGELFGYSFNDVEMNLCVDREEVRINDFAYSYAYLRPLRLLNCYSYSPAIGKKSNSGCPVMNDKREVIGMLVCIAGQNKNAVEGILVKATYIQEVINSLIRNNSITDE
ncbi:MAG: hypothetical protein SNH16_07760 [Rikenellaceae bacterium]